MANTAIWVRLMRKNRIDGSITQPCSPDEWEEALEEACRRLDVPRPLIINKNRRDWEAFSQTRFMPDSFMESVAFDRMEVEFINPEEKKKTNDRYL